MHSRMPQAFSGELGPEVGRPPPCRWASMLSHRICGRPCSAENGTAAFATRRRFPRRPRRCRRCRRLPLPPSDRSEANRLAVATDRAGWATVAFLVTLLSVVKLWREEGRPGKARRSQLPELLLPSALLLAHRWVQDGPVAAPEAERKQNWIEGSSWVLSPGRTGQPPRP